MAKKNLIQDKSFDFALSIIEVHKNLTHNKKEYNVKAVAAIRNLYWSQRK